MNGTHVIYVPRPDNDFGIAPGSGIVGSVEQASSDRTLVYYEGNLYGAENMHRFEERVYHAAGREVARYPTIAKMALPNEGLIEVGRFDYPIRRITLITNLDALRAWIPGEAEWLDGFVAW